MRAVALIAIIFCGCASAAVAAGPPGPALAQDRVLARAVAPLQVTSPAFTPPQPIPPVHTAYGKNLSIPLAWSAGPKGVKAYAIVMEELDPRQPHPALHWLVYNIPAGTTSIAKGQKDRAQIGADGVMQGRNGKGGVGYMGPSPSVGDAPHSYHIQVFALSRPLNVGAGATLDQVLGAMNDHVLAEGELIGAFEAPKPPEPKPDAKPKPGAKPKPRPGATG